jgi:hypothetical protein
MNKVVQNSNCILNLPSLQKTFPLWKWLQRFNGIKFQNIYYLICVGNSGKILVLQWTKQKRSLVPSTFVQYNIFENPMNIYEYIYSNFVLVYKVQPNRWYWYEYQYWKTYQSSMA